MSLNGTGGRCLPWSSGNLTFSSCFNQSWIVLGSDRSFLVLTFLNFELFFLWLQ